MDCERFIRRHSGRPRARSISGAFRLAHGAVPWMLLTVCVILCCGCAMFRLYPKVPVVQEFECHLFDRHPDPADACEPCRIALKRRTGFTPTSTASEYCGKSFDFTKPEKNAEESYTHLWEHLNVCACQMSDALKCAEAIRGVDAEFALCREERQLAIGITIATLAAGAGGAVAGGNSLAAVIMGSLAGAGLGLDFATFNSAKSAAFGAATSQVDCIYRTAAPSVTVVDEVVKRAADFKEYLAGALVPQPAAGCSESVRSAEALYKAEVDIGQRQARYAVEQLEQSATKMYQVIESTQVTAFAASQSGVVGPTQIQQGVASMSFAVPGLTTPTTLLKPAAVEVEGVEVKRCFDEQKMGEAEQQATTFRAALAAVQLQLPDSQFQQCLGLSVSTSAPAGGGSKGGNTGGGQGGNPGGGQGGNQGGQNSGASSPAPLTAQPSAVFVKNTNRDGVASIQVTGGTPPYYWKALDTCVVVASPEVRLLKRPSKDCGKENGEEASRVLIADQGGSQVVVYVASCPSTCVAAPCTSTPTTPTPCCCRTQ